MAPKILTISNQKGGVGKTTTAVSLAAGLARQGKEVLLIDLDPQGNAARALGMEPEQGTFVLLTMGVDAFGTQYVKQFVRNTGRDRLWLIAGNSQTSAAQITINALDKPVSHIRDCLRRFMNNGLDYIICDTSPSLGGLHERALWAADLVIVPTAADYLSTDGVHQMLDNLARIEREKGWKGALLGVLPTFVEDNIREYRSGLKDLRALMAKKSGRPQDQLGDLLLPPIHKAATLRECPSMGVTIFEKDPESRSAQEYEQLVKLVLRY